MQRLFFIIISSFFLLFSCAKQKPSGILSEAKMTKLLTEVSLIDAYLNELPSDSGRKVMPVLYANTFKEFDIDSSLFIQNLNYYYGNPKLSDKIFTDVQNILGEYDRNFRIEDSIRNVFVQDSISRISRIQRLEYERQRFVTDYYPVTSPLDYNSYAAQFLRHSDLNVNAYGVQIPAVPSPQRFVAPEEPIMQDSVLRKYLDMPVHKMILDSKIDTSITDFRFLNIFFLKNSGLNVKTGYTYLPRTKSSIEHLNVLNSNPESNLDEAVEQQSEVVEEVVSEQPISRNNNRPMKRGIERRNMLKPLKQ